VTKKQLQSAAVGRSKMLAFIQAWMVRYGAALPWGVTSQIGAEWPL
jgi:hypothetical protein